VKGVWVACAVGVVQVFLLVGTARAGGDSFVDDFLTFDDTRWTKEDHMLGRIYLNPQTSPSPTRTRGSRYRPPRCRAELRSNELYHHGSYSSRMKLPDVPSSITGFFLHRAPDHEREIDFEIFNDSRGRVMFTTYSGARQAHTVTKQLPFDPTAGYHTYAFRYDAGLARFMVDGKVMQTWKTAVPRGSMYLYTNLWLPSWLDGKKPLLDSYPYVDWTRYTSWRSQETGRALAATLVPQAFAQETQQPDELAALFPGKPGEKLRDRPSVFVVEGLHRPPALVGQLYDGRPPVGWVGAAPDQALLLQRVHQGRDVAPRHPELVADAAHNCGSPAVQRPKQPHPRVTHARLPHPRANPLHVSRTKRGELVHQPQGEIPHSPRAHRLHVAPRTYPIPPTPLAAS
jgi:hypothetical protein